MTQKNRRAKANFLMLCGWKVLSTGPFHSERPEETLHTYRKLALGALTDSKLCEFLSCLLIVCVDGADQAGVE